MTHPRFVAMAALALLATLPVTAAAQPAPAPSLATQVPATPVARTVQIPAMQAAPAPATPHPGGRISTAGERVVGLPPTMSVTNDGDTPGARATMRELRQVLAQYPPSVREVLALDPSLLSSPGYLDSYPALNGFLAAHPEIARNPSFFLPPREERGNGEDVMATLAIATSALGMMFLFITLVRTALQHRRWQQGLRAQQEMQSKLTERLLAREDLSDYLDTPSGRRLFETVRVDTDPQSTATPAGRILRSVHTGIVLVFLGAGFVMLQGRLSLALGAQMAAAGTVAFMCGLGFLVSAGASHVLSRRLGLFPTPTARD